VRALRLFAVLSLAGAGAAEAQLAVPQTQNLEKLLILNVPADPSSDSALAMPVIDAARDRLTAMARYKVMVVPKAKICEALTQSGFPCTALLTQQQAQQLAKALGVNSYNTGSVGHNGGHLVANVRIISGSSGFSSSFTVDGGNPGTPLALGEVIAQRLNKIVRAAEFARSCNEQRSRNALDRALAEANKAFAIEPNLTEAHLCVAGILEIKRAPLDSIVAALKRALKGDPGNQSVWGRVANISLQKADTAGALDAFDSLLAYNPGDLGLARSFGALLVQNKQFERAERRISDVLKRSPGDQALMDLRKRACIEGGLYSCTLGILRIEVEGDSTKLADTTMLKLALANAQAASDTQSLLWWARAAYKRYPTTVAFLKQLGGAHALAGNVDSALFYYRKAVAQNPSDVQTSLLIAKTIVDAAVWDTAAAGPCTRTNDTTCLKRLRAPFVAKVEPARQYLAAGFVSPDTAIRLTTDVIALGGGSKLAQAGAYDAAYPWLDQLLTQIAPRSPADTTGPRQAIRLQASFWYGLSSALSLGPTYQTMVKDKNCDLAKSINDRLQRSVQAIDFGGRVAPSVAIQMRSILMQYSNQMPKVKQAFKCMNF
jgi:tetratricopeptide (TPR) repeat protein